MIGYITALLNKIAFDWGLNNKEKINIHLNNVILIGNAISDFLVIAIVFFYGVVCLLNHNYLALAIIIIMLLHACFVILPITQERFKALK